MARQSFLTVTVERKYKRNKKFMDKVEKFVDRFVKCGVWGTPAKKKIRTAFGKTRTVGFVAVNNEFGTKEYTVKKTIIIPCSRVPSGKIIIKAGQRIKIPARPAFTYACNKQKYLSEFKKRIRSILERTFIKGGSAFKGWKDIADIAVDITRKSYVANDYVSNSPMTVALKGFNDPLFEYGEIYRAIHAKVLSTGREIKKVHTAAIRKINRQQANTVKRVAQGDKKVTIKAYTTKTGKQIKEHVRTYRAK